MTVNSLSSSHTSAASQASQPAARLPQNQPETQKGGAPQDKVTLSPAAQQSKAAPKSSGDVDHDGDSH
jgi:hypothetical protein